MTTATRTTKAGKITRILSYGEAVNGLLAASCTEAHSAGKITSDTYFLRRQPSDFGVAFTVEKTDGTVYDALLNAPGGGHSCDCPHGTYRPNSKPCRHVEMCLQALRERKI